MTKYAQTWACMAVLLVTLGIVTPSIAGECMGVQLTDSVKVGTADLALNGMGIRKATVFNVKVYVAGLYLPQKSGDSAKILESNQPWQLTLHFVHDVDAGDIRDAFEEGFKKASGDKLASLKPQIDALNSQMVDFAKGHYLAYNYDPSVGVVVDANGTKGGAIDGADFASTLLKITIGPEPPNEDLKSGLLGGKCE